jgi:hypothetical protein
MSRKIEAASNGAVRMSSAERWSHRDSDEQTEPEQERDGEPLGSLGGDVHADRQANAAMNSSQPHW